MYVRCAGPVGLFLANECALRSLRWGKEETRRGEIPKPVIDWKHTDVLSTAKLIAKGTTNTQETAKRCFEWVRDKIQHSVDFRRNPLTCSASEVLRSGTGYCYAKSHLLAALLRANGIPRGSAISDSASMKLARCIHCMA